MQANVSPKKVQRVGLDPVMSVSVVIQDPPFSMVDSVMRQKPLQPDSSKQTAIALLILQHS